MVQNTLGRNISFQIYNNDGTPFHDLLLKKSALESTVMSLGDKVTGDVYYRDNTLEVTMQEYIIVKHNPNDENEEGVKYVLVSPPTIVREGMVSDNSQLKGMTKYSFTFYHPMYMLGNFPFTDIAVSDYETTYLSQDKTFNWIGNLEEFVAKLNANLRTTEWYVSLNIPQSDEVQTQKAEKLSDVLSFDKVFISDALKTAYETWDIPFTITSYSQTVGGVNKKFLIEFGLPSQEIYTIDSHGDRTSTPFVFRFGQGVGLKNNSRTPKNNKIVTRIAGCGAERNIPYGYPQIVWEGDSSWKYTINNASGMQPITVGGVTIQAMSYPIYDGIVGGQSVKLIKHPFTRKTLMPSVYSDTVNRKVNPYATGYNPNLEILDYYDAIDDSDRQYPNNINLLAPSYEAHQFEDIYPRLNNKRIDSAQPYDDKHSDALPFEGFLNTLNGYITQSDNKAEIEVLTTLFDLIANGMTYCDDGKKGGSYTWWCKMTSTQYYSDIIYTSDSLDFKHTFVRPGVHPYPTWDDSIDDDGKYNQSYFKIIIPILNFDLYACASITEEMTINMRSGLCLGCSFKVAVDWDDYKKNFFDSDGTFSPYGSQRDFTKYPDSRNGNIELIVMKDTDTFGKLMPNVYQYPIQGDEFVFLGISLPTSYISSAEEELDDAMKEYMLENNVHYYDYPLKFDEFFLANNTGILEQMQNNNIVRFQYAGTEIALYIKQIAVKYGESVLPQYDITLTDDVEIVLSKIGQVTDDVSRMRVQVSEMQKYYNENIINAIAEKLSKIQDDVCLGRITFQQGLTAIGDVIFNGDIKSPQYSGGLYDGNGWRIDNLGNAELESLRVRSFLEVVELLINRLQAEEGDTMFTDNDQIELVQRVVDESDNSVSYILSLKEKYDGYITSQMYGNVIRGVINTLAAKQAGVSDYEGDTVEVDGSNTYYTSWMRVINTHNTDNALDVNQIQVVLYSDDYYDDGHDGEPEHLHHFTPAGKNFEPCELMTIARWGCVDYSNPSDPDYETIKASIVRRQRMFMISTTDGRVVKYTGVDSPILKNGNYGVTIGELPDFVKNYPDVSRILTQVGEHTDWLYAQGVVVGNFIKVDVQGNPEVNYVDCGAWVDGSQIQNPSPRNGIYYYDEWNATAQQQETHDVWHNNAKWRCLQHQPVVVGGVSHYYEPTDANSEYWLKLESGVSSISGNCDYCNGIKWDGSELPNTLTNDMLGQVNLLAYSTHEYVDLGLPSGTLWAKTNVGANAETDYGDYYMYGKGAFTYDKNDVPYTGTENPLSLNRDTARVVWENNWHTPTKTQLLELLNNTTRAIVTNYKNSGINGNTFTAPNGNVLFIPSGGYIIRGTTYSLGSIAVVWSSTPNEENPAAIQTANRLQMSSSSAFVNTNSRTYGQNVRPVKDNAEGGIGTAKIAVVEQGENGLQWTVYEVPFGSRYMMNGGDYEIYVATKRGWEREGKDGGTLQAQYAPSSSPSSSQIHDTWQSGDIYMRTKLSTETEWSSWKKFIGSNGSETEIRYNISQSKSSSSASTEPLACYYNEWQANVVAPTSTYPYLWMKITPKTWSDSSQSYVYGTPQYARVTGEKGENAFVADLENEMTSVALDEDGHLMSAFDLYFKVSAYYGSQYVLNESACTISATCSDQNVTVTATDAKTTGIRVQIASGTSLSDVTEISVTVTHLNYGTRNLVFTLAGVRGGKNAVLQELLPSLDAISFARTASGTLTPPFRSLSLSIKKTQGGTVSTQTVAASGLTVRWSPSSSPSSSSSGYAWGSFTDSSIGISWSDGAMQIASSTPITNVYIAAFNSSGTLVDRESIPIVKDGDNGEDGADGADGEDGVSYQISLAGTLFSIDDASPEQMTVSLKCEFLKSTGSSVEPFEPTSKDCITISFIYSYKKKDSDENERFDWGTGAYTLSGNKITSTYCDGDDWSREVAIAVELYSSSAKTTLLASESVQLQRQGSAGSTGARGKVGRFFYYAQEWSNSSSVSYVVSDAQAPYFLYNNSYWVFNPSTNGTYTMAQMGAPSSSNANWQIMTSDFKYIITEAIFGAYAHFGANIINGDYRLSQYGYMRGFYDSKVSVNNGTQYIYFDDSDPFGEVDMFDKPANKVANNSLSDYEIPDSTHYVILGNNIEFAPSSSPSATQIENTFTASCYYFRFKRTQDSTSWSSWLAFSSSYYFALYASNVSAPSTGWNYSGTVSNLVPTEEKPYLWMREGSSGTPFLVSSPQKSFTIEKGRYYAISIETENYDAGDFNIRIGTKNSYMSITSGSLKKELIGDALTYYGIFSNPYDSDFTNANLWTNKSGLSFTLEVVYKAQFVPMLCEDLKSGKIVANNIVARGELHADSLYYSMYNEESNNGTIPVEDKSIVSIGTTGVGSVVKLPSPSASKGRKVEVYNYATSWKATWDGATSASTFSCPYGSGLGYRTDTSITNKYVIFYCDGSKWWILRAEN